MSCYRCRSRERELELVNKATLEIRFLISLEPEMPFDRIRIYYVCASKINSNLNY